MGRKHRANRVKQYYLNDYGGSRTLAIVFACILCGLLAMGLLVFFLIFN